MNWIEEYPLLEKEWDKEKNAKNPEEYTAGSNHKVWWIGNSCGHSWIMPISSRTRRGGKCVICSNRVVLKGFNDCATTNPELVADFHPTKNDVTLDSVFAGSGKKMWWICPEGHEYFVTLLSRSAGTGCAICSGQKILSGYNDLLTKFPLIAGEWDENKNTVKPSEISPGTPKKFWWLCKKMNHSYYASVANRTRLGRGCAECSNQKIVAGSNDFASLHPEIAREWDYELNGNLLPTDVSVGRREPVYWLCKEEGHSWSATIRGRIGRSHGCPICCNRVVLAGYNDMQTTHPEASKLWHPTKNKELTPADVTRFSNTKMVWWQCPDGHEWYGSPNSMNHGRGSLNGCPECTAKSYVSQGERTLADYIESLGNPIIRTQRKLVKKTEYDIHIPEHKLLVEYNGLFYHSSAYKTPEYHAHKLSKANSVGHSLIQVWEDDWKNSREKVELILNNRLEERVKTITNLRSIDEKSAQTFLDKYRLGGFTAGTEYFASFVEDEMMAVASVSLNDKELLITGHSTLNGSVNIIRDLVDYFSVEGKVDFIRGVTSNDYELGNYYEEAGFSIESETEFDMFYFLNSSKMKEEEISRDLFKDKKNMKWKPNLSVNELLELNKVLKIYDSGHKNWVIDLR